MSSLLRITSNFGAIISAAAIAAAVPVNAADNQGTWSVAAQMTAARTEIGAVPLNGKIYVAGGQEMGRADSTLFQVFDPATGMWKDLAPMPKGASHIGITVLDGKIYVAGGFTVRPHVNPTDQFAVYDPAANKWQSLAPLSMKLGSVSLAAVDGKIHALGGRMAGEVTVNMHAVYDPNAQKWSTATPLPGPRDHMGVVVVNGRIHLIAGRNNDSPSDTTVQDIYDPATDKWTRVASLPLARSGGVAVFYRGQILYYGGECRTMPTRGAYDQVDSYDPKTDRWTPLAAPPAPLHAQGGAVVGDMVYILGGSTSCGSDKPSLAVFSFRQN
jgi:N-acetylneuraminic acid mutarotase